MLANAVLLLLAGDLIGHGNTSSSYFAGIGHNHTWVQDADAGIVLQCSKVFSNLQTKHTHTCVLINSADVGKWQSC
jgi:hypothetical protein